MKFLSKQLRQAGKIYKKNDFLLFEKLLLQLGKEVEEWNRKIALGEYGENKVYDALMDLGYDIIKFPVKKEGQITTERKIEKTKDSKFPDALATNTKEPNAKFGRHFFLDPKTKTSHKYLGIVNVVDYDGYWKFLKHGLVLFDFKIFFYIKETKKLYIHNLRDPHAEPTLDNTKKWLNQKWVYNVSNVNELTFWKQKD